MPKLSVIIPIYNVEDYLVKCLDSVLAQSFKDYECILVNDGSKDNSAKIAQNYVSKDERFKLINKENGGLSDARNAGLEVAVGKYVYFLDSDDFIEPTLFEKCIDKLEKTKTSMVIFDVYQYFQAKDYKEIIVSSLKDDQVYDLYANKEIIVKVLNAAWNKMYARSLFVNNGIKFPFGCYYEDLGTTFRLMLKARHISFINEPLYNYLADRPGNISQEFNFKAYHILDMVKINCDFYKTNNVYEEFYEELKFLAGVNIMECLKKTRNCNNHKMVNKYIDVCFYDIEQNWSEFPQCKYPILREKNDWIYAHKKVLKFYLYVRRLWH